MNVLQKASRLRRNQLLVFLITLFSQTPSMIDEENKIPYAVAKLVIGYLHNSLTEAEKDELDEWINASDENMKIFEDLTEGVDDSVFDPDRLLIQTEEAIDLWIIAGLMVRQQQNLNNEIEEKYLHEWANASERNKELFKQLQQPNFMHKILLWAKMQQQVN
jgi:hypothetical protein